MQALHPAVGVWEGDADERKDELLLRDRAPVLTMMTDTPAVVLLCLAAVLKCVCSFPVTSVFMLSPAISSYTRTDVRKRPKNRVDSHFFEVSNQKKLMQKHKNASSPL